jgi:ribosomal 50S subunit-associated protein YjgA (DUF615 family)
LRQHAPPYAIISAPIVTAHRRAPTGLRSTLDKRRSTSGGPPPASGGKYSAAGGDTANGRDVGGDEAFERPSRSARKRQAEALQKLGVGLTRLRPAKLRELQQHLRLPEALFEAILEVHRLRTGPALARQRQYIGRLMRDVDPEPIERALTAFSRSGDAKMHR